jgi:hypothetical protein
LLVSVLLCKQRGGIAACFMVLIYLIFTHRRYFWLKLAALLISVPLLSYGLNLFEEEYEGTMEIVYTRSTYDMVDSLHSIEVTDQGSGILWISLWESVSEGQARLRTPPASPNAARSWTPTL